MSTLLPRLGLALAVVWAAQASPLWAAIEAGLGSLDFDPARTALLAAWIGCFAAALLAAVLTGRPWPSALAATTLLAATYAAPWAWR